MNNTQTEEKILQVPIEDIIPNRFQPRLAFDDASLNDLAASIKQHGIIQPLVLRRKNDKYEIIAGERRYKAARMAGLLSVPAIISNLNDQESAEVAIVENVQRKDLTAIEEARSYQAILEKGYMTQEELAKKMGLSQSAISNKLRLLSLDESVQQAVIKEQISERHARSLLKVKDPEMQKVLLNKIISERLTVRQLEEEIRKITPEVNPNINNNLTINAIDALNNLIDNNDIKEETPNLNYNDSLTSQEDQGGNNMNVNEDNLAPFTETPEKVPNKFFNFLESQAANLSVEEPDIKSDLLSSDDNPVELLNKTDNIEMLDDFIVPSVANNNDTKDEYLNKVINTIRDLNFDNSKVSIEEINLPTEYHITIKIKKEKPKKH